MRNKRKLVDYESVVQSPRHRVVDRGADPMPPKLRVIEQPTVKGTVSIRNFKQPTDQATHESVQEIRSSKLTWINKKGHSLSFAGILLFTFLVYFRPYELFPSLAWLSKSAFVVALLTLVVFIPTQLSLENRITALPRELKLVCALLVTGVLSIPLALDPARAFESFIEYFKVIAIFIVMVNVIRTDKRLHLLILLVLIVSCVLSFSALYDYARGNLALEGRRIAGLIGGLFSNPNDLALHLVTMIPLSFAFMLASRGLARKAIYLGCCLLLTAGLVATFSRGGFLGFVCVAGFLVWKLARRNRVLFGALALAVVLFTIAVAPSAYRNRISTTNDASAIARTDDLKRSVMVASRHPLLGVGMDNYIIYSNLSKTTHNAYTQVAAEMGLAAFLIYLAFLITPFKRLRLIERDNADSKGKPRGYYLAVGLQASLVAYMVVSFFASVAYLWYVYYLVAYAVSLQRIVAVNPDTILGKTVNA
jgi:probable O-glycosylation ligase (exosortase A-associated)